MSTTTDYLANKLLDHVLRNVAYTAPATIYAGLLTTSPTDSTPGVEVTGGSYARQAATFGSAAATGQIVSTAVAAFPTATADWGTVVAVGLYDAVSGGNLLYYTSALVPKTILNGDTATLANTALTVRYS